MSVSATPRRWLDSHCHLQDAYRPPGKAEDDLVGACVEAGVGGVVCIGTDAESSRQAIAAVARIRAGEHVHGVRSWATVGLHPHEASSGVGPVAEVLRRAVDEHPGTVVAVGECGLDFHYDHSPRQAQRDGFVAQLLLARELGLTAVVHTREAWDETFDILRSHAPERFVLHCFSGGPGEARRALDMGAYLSFSGIITFKNAQDVRDALTLCPSEQLLVETDAPFLAPVPHRGEPNQPAWVAVVGAAAASIRGISQEILANSTWEATTRAFALS